MKKLLLAIVLIVGCDDAEDEEKSTIGICVYESHHNGDIRDYECWEEGQNIFLDGVELTEELCNTYSNTTWHSTYSSCTEYCEEWCSCSIKMSPSSLVYLDADGAFCKINEE